MSLGIALIAFAVVVAALVLFIAIVVYAERRWP